MTVSREEPAVSAGDAGPDSFAILYLAVIGRDDAGLRSALTATDAAITTATGPTQAVEALKSARFDAAVVDLAAGVAGVAVIRMLRAHSSALPILAVMDPAVPTVSAEAMQAGATDVLPWPCAANDFIALLFNTRDRQARSVTTASMPEQGDLFIYSASMQPVAAALSLASERRHSVLVTGQPGAGREYIARVIHARDADAANRPFIRVDCSASAADLERQMFGTTERGSQADVHRLERAANGSALLRAQSGTLLLVNLEEAAARVQARLARVLRDGEVQSSALDALVTLDVRIIGSAGNDIDGAVSDGRLRRDLVDRLAAVRIDLPALHRRREDIPMMAAHFLKTATAEDAAGPRFFSRAALALLAALPWRGNARELRDVVTHAAKSTTSPVVQLEDVLAHVSFDGGSATPTGGTLRQARAQFEREWISATLARHHGRVGEAAKSLGIQRTNLYRKVRQLNVPRSLMSGRK